MQITVQLTVEISGDPVEPETLIVHAAWADPDDGVTIMCIPGQVYIHLDPESVRAILRAALAAT